MNTYYEDPEVKQDRHGSCLLRGAVCEKCTALFFSGKDFALKVYVTGLGSSPSVVESRSGGLYPDLLISNPVSRFFSLMALADYLLFSRSKMFEIPVVLEKQLVLDLGRNPCSTMH